LVWVTVTRCLPRWRFHAAAMRTAPGTPYLPCIPPFATICSVYNKPLVHLYLHTLYHAYIALLGIHMPPSFHCSGVFGFRTHILWCGRQAVLFPHCLPPPPPPAPYPTTGSMDNSHTVPFQSIVPSASVTHTDCVCIYTYTGRLTYAFGSRRRFRARHGGIPQRAFAAACRAVRCTVLLRRTRFCTRCAAYACRARRVLRFTRTRTAFVCARCACPTPLVSSRERSLIRRHILRILRDALTRQPMARDANARTRAPYKLFSRSLTILSGRTDARTATTAPSARHHPTSQIPHHRNIRHARVAFSPRRGAILATTYTVAGSHHRCRTLCRKWFVFLWSG